MEFKLPDTSIKLDFFEVPQEKPRHPEGWSNNHQKAQRFKLDYCESCGQKEKLHAHHVDGDPANNEADNIQTLCTHCHNFLHATARRLGWAIPGRMPAFVQQVI